MKISKVGAAKGADGVKRKRKVDGADGADFAESLRGAAAAEGPGAVSGAQAVGSVDAVLAAQAVDDDAGAGARRQAKAYGELLLDQLDQIRDAILVGAVAKEKLVEIAQVMRARRQQVDDPKLQEILDEIELRAEVEIAKLTRED